MKNTLKAIGIGIILVAVTIGIFHYDRLPYLFTSRVSYETTQTAIKEVLCDDICQKQKEYVDNQRKLVDQTLANLEQLNQDSAVVDRAEKAYREAVDMHNESVQNYNETLEVLAMHSIDTLELFQDIAIKRGLLPATSTISYE